jgi:hypothetical protein
MPRTIRCSSDVQSVRNAAHNLLPNVAPQVVQSDAMESTANHAFPESLLAAMPQLSEKPRMGVRSKNPAWHPGFNVCNSTAVLGLQFRCPESVSGPVVAPNNGNNCSVLDPHCYKPGPVEKYVNQLVCEFNRATAPDSLTAQVTANVAPFVFLAGRQYQKAYVALDLAVVANITIPLYNRSQCVSEVYGPGYH